MKKEQKNEMSLIVKSDENETTHQRVINIALTGA